MRDLEYAHPHARFVSRTGDIRWDIATPARSWPGWDALKPAKRVEWMSDCYKEYRKLRGASYNLFCILTERETEDRMLFDLLSDLDHDGYRGFLPGFGAGVFWTTEGDVRYCGGGFGAPIFSGLKDFL